MQRITHKGKIHSFNKSLPYAKQPDKRLGITKSMYKKNVIQIIMVQILVHKGSLIFL